MNGSDELDWMGLGGVCVIIVWPLYPMKDREHDLLTVAKGQL